MKSHEDNLAKLALAVVAGILLAILYVVGFTNLDKELKIGLIATIGGGIGSMNTLLNKAAPKKPDESEPPQEQQ